MTTTQSMTDLVKRLLEPVIDTFFGPVIEPIKKEAADEIERLREALKIFGAYADYLDEDYGDYPDHHVSKAFGGNILVFGDFRKARAALKESE